eukprot:scaffold133834_cov32-Tisochrysis_lutea.AAC.3
MAFSAHPPLPYAYSARTNTRAISPRDIVATATWSPATIPLGQCPSSPTIRPPVPLANTVLSSVSLASFTSRTELAGSSTTAGCRPADRFPSAVRPACTTASSPSADMSDKRSEPR